MQTTKAAMWRNVKIWNFGRSALMAPQAANVLAGTNMIE